MNRSNKIVTALLSLAMILSLATSWKIQQDLRRELRAVTDANEILRKTLGDLMIAVTNKDKEIDRLNNSSCAGPGQKNPDFPPAPAPRNGEPARRSKPGEIGAE